MGEIIRNYREESLFTQGTVLHFRQAVADDSAMTSFLIFASTLLDADDQKVKLSDRTVNLSQLYPIYEEEAEVIRRVGAQKFFFELDTDFYDVKRPPIRLP